MNHLSHYRIGEYRIKTRETGKQARTGQALLRYEFYKGDKLLFSGEDYGVSPMHSIDSLDALLCLLAFLTVQPGDTDDEYFEHYTPEQMEWEKSHECETLGGTVRDAENKDSEYCERARGEFVNLDKAVQS